MAIKLNIQKSIVNRNLKRKNKRLSRIVRACKEVPGKELFQFIGLDGEKRSIDSGMVNDYIKKISGGDFTAKDFRTWAGTVQALLAFKELGFSETQTECKKKIVAALDVVSKLLGNTRTVCKKYYVHPVLLTLYEDKSLQKHLSELDSIEKNDDTADLTSEEKVLMRILAAC